MPYHKPEPQRKPEPKRKPKHVPSCLLPVGEIGGQWEGKLVVKGRQGKNTSEYLMLIEVGPRLCGSAEKSTTNVYESKGAEWLPPELDQWSSGSVELVSFSCFLYPSFPDAREDASVFQICSPADFLLDGSKSLQGLQAKHTAHRTPFSPASTQPAALSVARCLSVARTHVQHVR
ncbi:unnamed protein product [[Candida] boidinii]|nr:unnamed protein product [[Candida] boidinii]